MVPRGPLVPRSYPSDKSLTEQAAENRCDIASRHVFKIDFNAVGWRFMRRLEFHGTVGYPRGELNLNTGFKSIFKSANFRHTQVGLANRGLTRGLKSNRFFRADLYNRVPDHEFSLNTGFKRVVTNFGTFFRGFKGTRGKRKRPGSLCSRPLD